MYNTVLHIDFCLWFQSSNDSQWSVLLDTGLMQEILVFTGQTAMVFGVVTHGSLRVSLIIVLTP